MPGQDTGDVLRVVFEVVEVTDGSPQRHARQGWCIRRKKFFRPQTVAQMANHRAAPNCSVTCLSFLQGLGWHLLLLLVELKVFQMYYT